MTGGGSVLRIEGLKHSNLETGAPMSEKPISPLRQRMLEDMSRVGSHPTRNVTTSALSRSWRPF
jgi:hypothetical protein